MSEKILVFDSTLRDGAQAEGISFSVEDKIRVVETLDKMGIDYIEAGNPGSNPKDIEFFNRIKGIRLNHAKLVAGHILDVLVCTDLSLLRERFVFPLFGRGRLVSESLGFGRDTCKLRILIYIECRTDSDQNQKKENQNDSLM